MTDPARLEALALAGDLPGVLLDARRLAASAPGVHGRRRAGQGEAFWQYRDHRAEDGARLVDWRRSARGDRYFVREREREAAQTAWFWIDPDRRLRLEQRSRAHHQTAPRADDRAGARDPADARRRTRRRARRIAAHRPARG